MMTKLRKIWLEKTLRQHLQHIYKHRNLYLPSTCIWKSEYLSKYLCKNDELTACNKCDMPVSKLNEQFISISFDKQYKRLAMLKSTFPNSFSNQDIVSIALVNAYQKLNQAAAMHIFTCTIF